ncbi:MAG: FliM/FliN family flagellar motor switch protein [Pseudomonadota bacterium]
MTAHDVLVLDAPVKPLRLRQVTADAARLQSALSKVIEPLLISTGGASVFAALDAPRPPAPETPWLGFTIDGAPAAIQLSWGLARRLAGLPLEGVIPEDAALLIEEALAPALDDLEAALGIALRLTDLSDADPTLDVATTVNLHGKDSAGKLLQLRLAARLSPEAAQHFAAALQPRRRTRADLPGLTLRLTRELGAVAITPSELQSLQPGDAIELADPAPRLILQNKRAANAAPEATGLRLASGFTPLAHEQETPMSDDTATLDRAVPETTLDDLDIRLSFRAGEAEMSLKALRELAPGSIIEMTDPATAEVEILANGRPVGTGELINVAGRRAVQIRRLFAG